MTGKYFTGVAEDPRPKKEQKKDWKAEELLAGSVNVDWKEKKDWKEYTERNQFRSSSCVPQSVAKLLEINEKNETGKKVVFSASKAYAERTNVGAGSWLQEMLKYAVDPAYYCEERQIKSQMLTSDNQIALLAQSQWNEHTQKTANIYSGKSYLSIRHRNIDNIAYWVSQGYGVSILIYADYDEWARKYPVIKRKVDLRNAPIRHAVAVVDYGLKNGKKYLKIEDSAHFGNKSERWVNEDFIKERCYDAGFVFDKPNENPPIEKYIFNINMWYGMRRHPEVIKLQDRLKNEGYFPLHIPSTGNYLEITRQAVEKYQRTNKVASEWELNLVRGRIVGPKTRKALNNLV